MILRIKNRPNLVRFVDKILLLYSEMYYIFLRLTLRVILKKTKRDEWILKNNYTWMSPIYGKLILVTNSSGLRLWCRADTDDVEHASSDYEKISLSTFNPKVNDFVVDIGANIGRYTLHSSKLVGKKGKVIAIEPFKQTYDLLRKNIKENSTDNNILTFCIGLSNHEGREKLYLDEKLWGRNTINPIPGGDYVQIEMLTLDSLVENLQIDKIDWIKIDVEGHEYEVLEGGKNTLLKNSSRVMIEVRFDNFKKVINLLQSLGYSYEIVETSISFYNILAKKVKTFPNSNYIIF